MPEVRVMSEGSLRAVQASGSGRTWATGSAPTSAFIAYVESFSYTSAQTLTTIMERGLPDHHKVTEKAPIDFTFNAKWTGGTFYPASGAGASVPMYHFEFKALAPENGATSAFYSQFHGVAIESLQFTEGKEADTIAIKGRALAMNISGSGYLG